MRKEKQIKFLRWILLALITLFITTEAYLHIKLGGGESPSIHALCPFGGLESLYQIFTAGSFISKIFAGTLVLFGVTVLLAILFRRSFCGLLCPFGAIQEFFAKMGQKIFRKKFVIPAKVDKPLRYLKYLVLIITVLYAWRTAGLWMAPYDPWSAYGHLPEGLESVWGESAVGLILLVITLIGSLLYDRFFCKYLCPMGALYGILGKVSPFKVVRNENTCIDCGKCNRSCPMNIDIQHNTEVKSAECINCQLCVLECPKPGALENKEGQKSMKPLIVIALVVVVFFGSILTFKAAGVYTVLPAPLKAGEAITYDEIKGYMTIKDAAEATNTPLEHFYTTFKIPKNVPAETMMKEISKTVPDYNWDEVKESLEK
ncbi:4Fe-4S binding protein [Desulfitobacterium metallireducens]|uniref:4Fe-4S ferredoxin n=1 Tax=Desulfitobacterium metallireducens DSM 15288 TaxID=871968 RepID=W0EBZ0_9FIRM|nr:4Fe-4S binding protein [Desulfitobacterium metallireducens]AHF06591.1 4Fe-4S ferredoxin [Desulfitobacterium metallireducens DSM 15288]